MAARFLFLKGARKRDRTMNSKRKKIYEGKAKILYEGPEPGTLIQYFKDDATAFNAQKKAVRSYPQPQDLSTREIINEFEETAESTDRSSDRGGSGTEGPPQWAGIGPTV